MLVDYCKFGFNCKLEYVKDICNVESCDTDKCIQRHPIKCKLFSFYGYCKFGNYCAYSHSPSEDKVKINDIEKY